MNTVFAIMFVQALLGAFDNFWHHEMQARLPQRASAREELVLHSAREAIYALLFSGFAWLEWHGAWALVPAALLATEVAITCADFLEEDRSRRLPPLERVLHTVLAVAYGVLLGFLAPVLVHWAVLRPGLLIVDHGAWSYVFSACAVAVLAWSARNALAVIRMKPRHAHEQARPAPPTGPAVLVTGGTGFIGSELVRQLTMSGHRVIVLTRDVVQARATFGPGVWALDQLRDIPSEARIGAVIHLAGAQVLGVPWTRKRREKLISSRTSVMAELLQLMRRLEQRPEILVSASAVGFYGVPALGRPLGEDASPQPGSFQSDLCCAIEHEARRAEALGVRVVRMRFGLVLGRAGGSYPPLAFAARLGLAARLGSGTQPVPWIHLQDAVALLRFALANAAVRGAVNAVAPHLVNQAKFSRELARSFGRGMFLKLPGWILRTVMGDMSELLLEGQPVLPRAALASGFSFQFSTAHDAFAQLRGARPTDAVVVNARTR